MTDDVYAIIRDVYAKTIAFYGDRRALLGIRAHGYRILYGPPVRDASILFVGYQPGGDYQHIEDHQHIGWPEESDYSVQRWPLAKRVRETWDAAEIANSTGLNAIFFRSPSVEAWKSTPSVLRNDLERFSHVNALRIIAALAPRKIIFIGMGSMARFVEAPVDALNVDGRVLIRSGIVCGIPAYGVVHLSGARISTAHRAAIRAFFAAPTSC